MKNKDMPARPIVNENGAPYHCSNIGIEFNGGCCTGLTKREVFAMNAPDVPEWFKIEFSQKHMTNEDYYRVIESCVPSNFYKKNVTQVALPKGEMALIKAWRYHFADTMLEE